mgnify:CR=1 FL=1
MVQRALAGKLETNEEQALQKLDQKRKQKSRHLVIELPELNTVLVEAFGELNHTTHVAKEIARCSTNKNGKWSCGGHEVYSFLDGFSNYNQIRIHRKIKRKWLLSPNGGCLLHW